MSHFTCLVIGEDVEGQLAPYDENTPVEPYKAYWDSDDITLWERSLQTTTFTRRNAETDENEEIEYPPEQVLGAEYTLEDMRRVYMARFHGYKEPGDEDLEWLGENGFEVDDSPLDQKLHIDDGGIWEWSTYNPKSKWDWWVVGGRWRGYFKLKDDAKEMAVVGEPGAIYDNEPRYDSDEARKGDIDIEGMRAEAALKAGSLWDRVNEAVGHMPEAISWEEYAGRVVLSERHPDEPPYTIEQARKDYHEQPRVVAFKEWDELLPKEERISGFFGLNVEDFQITREEYVQIARDNALCPYAYLVDGEWHAPGKMGWFGASSDNRSDRTRFAREFNEMLDALPDDTLLTLCDLHI